jgi:hypothetical protein
VTTHYADFGANAGLTVDSVTLFAVTPAETTAAAVKTATATVEHTPGSGVYRTTFDTVAAGTYLLRAIAGGTLRASWFVEFAGTDGEIVLARLDYEQGGGWDVTVSVPASTAADALTPNSLTVHRGDTFVRQYTGLGDISDRTKLWVTIKRQKSQTDAQALFQFTEADGLLTFNGAAASSAGLASVVVDDEDEGDITITIDESLTAQLRECLGWHWDVQVRRSNGRTETPLQNGVFNVTEDVTRATE